MRQFSLPRLVLKRLAADWALLTGVFFGIVLATTLVAVAPTYLNSLEQLAFNTSLDRFPYPFLKISVYSPNVALTEGSLAGDERSLSEAVDGHISSVYRGHETSLKGDLSLIGLPSSPLPQRSGTGALVSRGYFQYLSNLALHASFLEGHMAGRGEIEGQLRTTVEAVISAPGAERFALEVGETVTLSPDLGTRQRITARIVGIFEPDDRTDEYWDSARLFIDPAPIEQDPPAGVRVDPEEPPLPLFVARQTLVNVVGETYEGSLVTRMWFLSVDKERMKKWSLAEASDRLTGFENSIARSMPGSWVATRLLQGMIDGLQRRSFFSSVPILLLLAIVVVTVLFYLGMIVSYLVQSREGDTALFRTRGVGMPVFLRLFALEALLMTVAAVALAPFLALAIVALAGKLNYFRDLTGGGLLPVRPDALAFLAAGAAGLLCLLVLVLPGALGARAGLVVHRLRSSRPPAVSFFHRYYLDVLLLVLGGLMYWELQSRGHLVSGGLFKDVEVNEALLLAPVLFLVVVALVFIRLFPLLVRFVAGESAQLMHLAAALTVLGMTGALLVSEIRGDSSGSAWPLLTALLMAVGAVYWLTNRATKPTLKVAGLTVQAGLVGLFLSNNPLEPGHVLFVPSIVLVLLVPTQALFLVLAASAKAAPVWLAVGVWHMARNPLQYTWLVLLLVLVTGVGILSSTVGGTLERSQRERVMYSVPTDLRITGIPPFLAGRIRGLKDRFLAEPGVTAGLVAFRGFGNLGPFPLEVLALETRQFQHISWYRQDFSARPLSGVMGALQGVDLKDRFLIPEGATEIGLWAKPAEIYGDMSVWVVIANDAGATRTISLGTLDGTEWQRLSGQVPSDVEPPLYLASVQIFQPGRGAALSAGEVLLDEISVSPGPDGGPYMLEDFESHITWLPIITSDLSEDVIDSTSRDAHHGKRSGIFTFGKESSRGVRGIYQSPTGGPVPVVFSESLALAWGARVGERFVLEISGRRIPVVLRDTVRYFPTISPNSQYFVIGDIDSLLGYLNILGYSSRMLPNEIFLAGAPLNGTEVSDPMAEVRQLSGRVQDRASLLESVRLDPLITAGWKGMAALSLGVVVLAAGLGYASYLLSFARRSRTEVGFLQSMGLSRGQLVALLGFEHMVITLVGLGLGTWAGFQMSRLMVSSLAVTETGAPVMPPFILMTDWSLVLPTYAVLVGVFAGAVLVLNLTVGRLDLTAIARSGETR